MADDELEQVWRAEFLARIYPAFRAACRVHHDFFAQPGDEMVEVIVPPELGPNYGFETYVKSHGTPAWITATYASGGNVKVVTHPGTHTTYTMAELTPESISTIVDAWVAAIKARG
jgi:hypothetical protein